MRTGAGVSAGGQNKLRWAISGGHDRCSAGDLVVNFDSIYHETADPDCLKINTCCDHPSVAVVCVELEPNYIIML
jgi:hypothetical protein